MTEFVTEKMKRLPHTKDLIQGLEAHLMSSSFLKKAFDCTQSALVGIFKLVKTKE